MTALQRIIHLSPEPAATSETFIRAHREYLPFAVISLFRWRAPYRTADGRWVAFLPGTLRLLADRLKLRNLTRATTSWLHRELAQWLRNTGACAVLAEYGPLGANIAPACSLARIPLVVIFHGFDAYQQVTLDLHNSLYKELFSIASALVVVSEPMRQQLIQLGAPPERLVVNSCGVDPAFFPAANPADAEPHFLAVGRFVSKKGPMQTIRAFARVLQVVPEARLTMIGTGPLLADSKALAEKLGLLDVISFLGACSHSTVQAQLRQARAVVQHSLRCTSGDQEGTPVSLMEAQMAGVPVVSTRHAGIPAVVIDGQTGYLVAEGDEEGMADAMIRLALDPSLAAKQGVAARDHAMRHHTLDRHITSLSHTIHRVLAQSLYSHGFSHKTSKSLT
ncbi:MAG: glycosyltransferase [Cyanobacteriota bacterium]